MKKLCILLLLIASTGFAQPKTLDLKTVNPLLYFTIENIHLSKGKAVVLYTKNDMLNYAFIDSSAKIEFAYPKETDEETPGFIFDTTKNDLSVSFANRSASYRVYEMPKKIGVEATIGGILYEQIGVVSSKKGSLKDLLRVKLDNLIVR